MEEHLSMLLPVMLCVWWQSALCCGSASLVPELGFAGAQRVDLWSPALQGNSPLLPRDTSQKRKKASEE